MVAHEHIPCMECMRGFYGYRLERWNAAYMALCTGNTGVLRSLMRICLFRVDRMAYIGAEGIAVCVLPDSGARYDKDYKYDEKNTNHKQSIFFIDTECHNHRNP